MCVSHEHRQQGGKGLGGMGTGWWVAKKKSKDISNTQER